MQKLMSSYSQRANYLGRCTSYHFVYFGILALLRINFYLLYKKQVKMMKLIENSGVLGLRKRQS